jgi:hypothetical protein
MKARQRVRVLTHLLPVTWVPHRSVQVDATPPAGQPERYLVKLESMRTNKPLILPDLTEASRLPLPPSVLEQAPQGVQRVGRSIIALAAGLALFPSAAHAHDLWDNGEPSRRGSRPNAVDRRTPIICAPIRSGATRLAITW